MSTHQPQAVNKKMQSDIYPHGSFVTREMRNQRLGHASGVIWLTGLSGAGKSSISTRVEQALFARGYLITVLDGDTIRTGLNADLDFSQQSRQENLRRAGEVASLFAMAGHIVLATFVSPFQDGRQYVREIIRENFYLVHVHAQLEDCIERDPKGLYQKAMGGGIENFTGVGQNYEPPLDADMVINTSQSDIDDCSQRLLEFILTTFTLTEKQ